MCSGRSGGDYSTDSDMEYEFGDVDDERELKEMYKLRSESVTEVVKAGNVVALFSPSFALELFYLCIVIKSGTDTEDMHDKFEH